MSQIDTDLVRSREATGMFKLGFQEGRAEVEEARRGIKWFAVLYTASMYECPLARKIYTYIPEDLRKTMCGVQEGRKMDGVDAMLTLCFVSSVGSTAFGTPSISDRVTKPQNSCCYVRHSRQTKQNHYKLSNLLACLPIVSEANMTTRTPSTIVMCANGG